MKDMRKHIDEAINKVLKRGDIKYGFAEYKCEICGESTKVSASILRKLSY